MGQYKRYNYKDRLRWAIPRERERGRDPCVFAQCFAIICSTRMLFLTTDFHRFCVLWFDDGHVVLWFVGNVVDDEDWVIDGKLGKNNTTHIHTCRAKPISTAASNIRRLTVYLNLFYTFMMMFEYVRLHSIASKTIHSGKVRSVLRVCVCALSKPGCALCVPHSLVRSSHLVADGGFE